MGVSAWQITTVEYYHNDYQAAAEAYRQAIAGRPTEAVYHSNLALALEELQAPGERAAELEEAISALRRARELRPDESKYAERLNKLERQHRFVMRYGESALKLKPVVRPIEVFLQSDLLPCILSENTDTLSDEMLQLIDEMRNSIRQRFGLTLPGVLFTTIEDETQAQPGAFRFSLMEVPVDYGVVALGKKFALSPLNKLASLGRKSRALSMAPIWKRRTATRGVARSPARCTLKIRGGKCTQSR